jgi:ribosomal protein L11 methylase PrmA
MVLLTGDYKQGQNVFVAAFRLLQTVVVTVLNDNDNPFISEKSFDKSEDKLSMLRSLQNSTSSTTVSQTSLSLRPQKTESSSSSPQQDSLFFNEKSIEKVKRTKEWYTKATYYLHMILVKIFSITRQQYSQEQKNSQVSIDTFFIEMKEIEIFDVDS